MSRYEETVSVEIIEKLLKNLPDFFKRSDVEKLTSGLFTAQTLNNLNGAGKGPKVHRMGRQVCYLKEEFVAWLVQYYRGMSNEHTGFGEAVHKREGEEA